MTHIAVDLDGVVLDFVGGLREAVYREYGVEVAEGDVTEWDLSPVLDPVLGRPWWTWLRERSWLWARFPPIPGAIGGLRQLHDEGHLLECVTSKPEWAERSVWCWLAEHAPAFDRVTIVREGERKSEATQAQLLIDDKLENCEEFAATGRAALLFDHPYNQSRSLPTGVTRVQDWHAVLREVRAFAARQAGAGSPPGEAEEIMTLFTGMLRQVTADGQAKRRRGEKPSWKVDRSHEAAVFSHMRRWKAGELADPDSGAHPLVHAAWRMLAIAAQELDKYSPPG